jgi:hypothetical protein
MNIKKVNFKKIKDIPLIDFIGIAVFFAILFFAMFFFLRRSEYVVITVKLTDHEEKYTPWIYSETPEWYLENISPGLEEKDLLGRSNIKVEDLYYYPTLNTHHTVFLKLKIRTAFNRTTKQYLYKGSPLLIGSYNEFTVAGMKIPAIVTQIGSDNTDTGSEKIVIKGYLDIRDSRGVFYPAETSVEGIEKYIADKFVEGLKVYDSKGNVITEILSVDKKQAYRQFIYQNSLVKVLDNNRVNVEFTAEISVKLINGRYFYREEDPVFTSNILGFSFEDFWVAGTITEVTEFKDQ